MGKIDELIKELCPDGVEYVKLGNVCNVKRGKRLTKSQLKEYRTPEYRYPVLHGGLTPMGYYKECNRKPDTTIVVNTGNAGSVYFCNDDFWSSDACFSLYPNESLNDKFLYFYLSGKEYILKGNIRAGAMPTIDATAVEMIQIPLPPLSIQQQIVEILDTFTDSISNLQEELELREKQMEYYRENIMTSEKVWKTLGEIGTLIRGKRFCHRDAVENGIPCIHYGELYTYYGVSTDVTKSFVRDDLAAKLRFAKKGDVVIVGAGENDIDIGVGVAYYGDKQVAVHDACYTLSNHNMSPKFISYWLRTNTYHQQIRQYVSSGKICSISTEGLAKARIPVPSLSRQQEIVDILDTFESMIANIKQEIELRQKQYEYYREKLLTFD